MSTNPFRRSFAPSNFDAADTAAPPGQSLSSHGPDRGGSHPIDISVDTKVPPSSTDRHVSFASPPVDSTFTAVSYPSTPSSPEDTRISPAFQYARPVAESHTDYRIALHSDPFQGDDFGGQGDRAIQEALQNAQQNATAGAPSRPQPNPGFVLDTLSRFASTPKRAPQDALASTNKALSNNRQTMDVEAFKRLLLTGDVSQANSDAPAAGQSIRLASDNSSAADTASISQASINDTVARTAEDTPRTSQELERDDVKMKPAAPPPRRAKSVKTKASFSSDNGTDLQSGLVSQTSKQLPTSDTAPVKQTPPPPPLARRQSQRTQSYRSERVKVADTDADSSDTASIASFTKVPPAPPVRRQTSMGDRHPSTELAPTLEEPQEPSQPQSTMTKPSGQRPPPPPTRNSTKRMSMGAPSAPPPRRGRASSRSSMDSFKPSPQLMPREDHGIESTRTSTDLSRPSEHVEGPTDISNASSILAQLANLQKDLDAARSKT